MIKAIVISKITDFTFCWEKEQMADKILKSKRLSIEPWGISFTIFVQSLNFELILILCVNCTHCLDNVKIILYFFTEI